LSLSSAACCCAKCFFGSSSEQDSFTGCAHTIAETLNLRIPRPAYTGQKTVIEFQDAPGATCPCAGTYNVSTNCPASDCIEVNYSHFHKLGNARLYTWFYEKGLVDVLWPACNNPCAGYSNATCDDDTLCGETSTLGSSTHRNGADLQASCFQQQAIIDGTIPHDDRTSIAHADDLEFGDAYHWLQGIADASTAKNFTHYAPQPDGSYTTQANNNLNATLLCVVHKEKWWHRTYNSLSQTDNSSASNDDNSASGCRTPKYWIFACTGVPLFSWEVVNAENAGTISSSERVAIFSAWSSGGALPEDAIDKLEAAGILDVEDFDRGDGKIIKKSMTYTESGASVTEDWYFYGRPGGWDYVCQDWSGSTTNFDSIFPQIPRRTSVGCSFGPTANQCYTAAPLPGNGCSCQRNATNQTGTGICQACMTSYSNVNCTSQPTTSCGSSSGGWTSTCTQDTIVGNCKGLWIQFTQYDLVDLSTASYGCTMTNDAYLCRIPPGGSCDFGLLPDEMGHNIPEEVSGSIRAGNSPSGFSGCCGGLGTYQLGSAVCPATTPRGDACADPDQATSGHPDGWAEDVCD
jgi:hypothetical protein